MKPAISVVIATWQRPALLERCLKALINQSLDHSLYEIIVVTDGPDLRSMNCVDQVRQQVFSCPAMYCIALPVKKGPAAARNAGWRSALGELIVFTDDDCVPLYFFLDHYWHTYRRMGRQFIAFSGKVQVPLPAIPTDYEKNIAQLERASFVTANCACTRKALLRVGGLDESFTMPWREDAALEFACLWQNIPILRVSDAIVVHPVRPAPWGISIREEKKNLFNSLLYKKFPILYKRRINNKPPWYYYAIVAMGIATVWAAITNSPWLGITLVGWLLLTGWFAAKRLQGTSKKPRHVLEMLYTSVVIPYVSVFWNFYGAVKFKTLLL
jgi:glycosyltransferase involved in cell wall biosynthesis